MTIVMAPVIRTEEQLQNGWWETLFQKRATKEELLAEILYQKLLKSHFVESLLLACGSMNTTVRYIVFPIVW